MCHVSDHSELLLRHNDSATATQVDRADRSTQQTHEPQLQTLTKQHAANMDVTTLASLTDLDTMSTLTSLADLDTVTEVFHMAGNLSHAGNGTAGGAPHKAMGGFGVLVKVVYAIGIVGNACAIIALRRGERRVRNRKHLLLLTSLAANDLVALVSDSMYFVTTACTLCTLPSLLQLH